MTATLSCPGLPNFLFNAWKLREGDLLEAKNRNELAGWNVSSLCSIYLKYQLDRYNDEVQRRSQKVVPSLFSLSLGRILELLSQPIQLHEAVRELTASYDSAILLYLLRDPRTPYKLLRLLDASQSATIAGSGGKRKLVDIDEAVLASEQYARSADPACRDGVLVKLDDLSIIHGPLDEKGMLSIERKSPPKGGFEFLDAKRAPVLKLHGTDQSFIKTFDRVTHGILKGLDWNHVLVAGGIVLNTLLHTDPCKGDLRDVAECDIDLYLYSLTPEEANRKVEEVYNCWFSNLATSGTNSGTTRSDIIVLKNSRTINFIPKYPNRRIQIILKLSASPLDILLNFDLDACALGYDGSRVLLLPRCARALESGYSVFTMDLIWGHHLGNRRETQEIRVFKYADRGFGLRMLPSYVQSLEEEYDPDAPVLHKAERDVEAEGTPRGKSKARYKRTERTRLVKGEHGLKTVKRIAYLGQQFVQKFYFGDSNPLVKTLRIKREEIEEWGNVIDDLTRNHVVSQENIIDDEMSKDDNTDTSMDEGSTTDASLVNFDADADDAEESPDDIDESDLDMKRVQRIAAEKMDNRPIIRLCAIDGRSTHEALPDGRKGLAVFELLMRHCEAWRLDAVGQAWLDRSSFASISYDDMNTYHNLPTYQWGPNYSFCFSIFERLVEEYNNALFRLLRMTISDRVHIHHRQGSFVDYLTRKIRCMVVGQDLKTVQDKQITIPLVIPADLQTAIVNELRTRDAGISDEIVSKLVIPVHDSSKWDPRSASVPSLADNATESGNLRYWLLTNETMWAGGQRRALDEVAELLVALCDWFARGEAVNDLSTGLFNLGTDNGNCIWHLARMFRRRLILPEGSEKAKRGQILTPREARLFRAWVLSIPARVDRDYTDDDRVMAKFEKKLAKSGDVPDKMFWTDGDQGSWGTEEGVPIWHD
ncbi:MAG: hypothetical protein LQ352_006233 [Teloschistes flavicans]|nr:MAG: hypothetical protein LQ352_006233 [Teloschistes flavicans]